MTANRGFWLLGGSFPVPELEERGAYRATQLPVGGQKPRALLL